MLEEVEPAQPNDGPIQPLMSPYEVVIDTVKVDTLGDGIPENSVFHPHNFNPVVLIQLSRLYDVQMALLAYFDEPKAKLMAAMHERGELATPPPAFNTEEE